MALLVPVDGIVNSLTVSIGDFSLADIRLSSNWGRFDETVLAGIHGKMRPITSLQILFA
jgi:hypothetical protein